MGKEKKEIWMEKLIELLNEYLNDKVGYIQYHNEYWFKQTKTKYEVEWERFLQDEYVLGKKFWFIKWLVENDKIGRDKCWFKNEWLSWNWYDSGIAFVQNYDNDTFKISEFYSPYLQLLMLLSISDTPIEFLVSILK